MSLASTQFKLVPETEPVVVIISLSSVYRSMQLAIEYSKVAGLPEFANFATNSIDECFKYIVANQLYQLGYLSGRVEMNPATVAKILPYLNLEPTRHNLNKTLQTYLDGNKISRISNYIFKDAQTIMVYGTCSYFNSH